MAIFVAGMNAARGVADKGSTTTSSWPTVSPWRRNDGSPTSAFLDVGRPDLLHPTMPPLPARASDARSDTREPTMREKMLEHRVRLDKYGCHRLMDPIGFALENFDGIGLWRSHDEGDFD